MEEILRKGREELEKVPSLDRGYKCFPGGKHVRVISVVPECDENGTLYFSASFRRASLETYFKNIKDKLDRKRFSTAQEAADYVINLAEQINSEEASKNIL